MKRILIPTSKSTTDEITSIMRSASIVESGPLGMIYGSSSACDFSGAIPVWLHIRRLRLETRASACEPRNSREARQPLALDTAAAQVAASRVGSHRLCSIHLKQSYTVTYLSRSNCLRSLFTSRVSPARSASEICLSYTQKCLSKRMSLLPGPAA